MLNIQMDMIRIDMMLMSHKFQLDMMLDIRLNLSKRLGLKHFDIVNNLLLDLCRLHMLSCKADREELRPNRINQ